MREPRQPSRSPAQGFAGLADLFPNAQGGVKTAKSIEQRVEPPTRLPVARSAYVAPTSYLSPSAFQVPTAFASRSAESGMPPVAMADPLAAPPAPVPVSPSPALAATPDPVPMMGTPPAPAPLATVATPSVSAVDSLAESAPSFAAGPSPVATSESVAALASAPAAAVTPTLFAIAESPPAPALHAPTPLFAASDPRPASAPSSSPVQAPSSGRVEPTLQAGNAAPPVLVDCMVLGALESESNEPEGTGVPAMLPPLLPPAPAPAVSAPLPPPLLPGAQPGAFPSPVHQPLAQPPAPPVPPMSMPPVSAPPAPVPGVPGLPSDGAPGLRPPKSSGVAVWIWLAAGVLLIVLVAVGLVQWFARYERPSSRPQASQRTVVTPERPPAAPTAAPSAAPTASIAASSVAASPVPVPELSPSRPELAVELPPPPPPTPREVPARPPELPLESRPPVGDEGRVLDAGQIRYCVAQNMRLNTQNKLVRADLEKEVNRYNDLLNDYNARCRNFKYERSELQRVVAVVESDRGQIEAQAKSDWLARRDDVLEDAPVRPPAPPASVTGTPSNPNPAPPPRAPRRVEPAERPLWWCLPGPENKCVPM